MLMPPPTATAVLPEIVLFLTLTVPVENEIPPPPLDVATLAKLPLMVDSVTVSVPLLM
jgi:hypothetical protein